jgi:hypothetical protein
MQTNLFSNLNKRGEEGQGLLWKTILLVLAAICIVTLLIFFNKVINILKPEKVSVTGIKTIIAELKDLQKELDETKWGKEDRKMVDITVPIRLKGGNRIETYNANPEAVNLPAANCAKVPCLVLHQGTDILYVGFLPKSITFSKEHRVGNAIGEIEKFKLEMEKTDGGYIASVDVVNDEVSQE